MSNTSLDQLKRQAIAVELRDAFRAYLAEDYDGIGQFALIYTSRSSVSAGVRAKIPAGDFAANGRLPAGTPVICYIRRGFAEILGVGAAKELGMSETFTDVDHEITPLGIVSSESLGSPVRL